ncbi:hypothetical protein BJ508DRAFT_418747 [Ascobolus immersus RN42]|uniref:Uncharacterized protein n=1 Tax=Ascobolus immersus RN42 TaxID=1160509 RepID=A0A3N4HJV7_ASCIM|nr:hypothetical protein BJ508DRAFT_418747 [Ascobolus immersus RN42]
MAPSNDELVSSIRALDMKSTIDTFLAGHNNELTKQISNLLSAIAEPEKIREFIKELVSTISDAAFRERILHSLEEHIKNYPWQTAFFTAGVVLLANPLNVLGFGELGPVAGTTAAAWQSSMGNVPARTAFTVLQRWGMIYGFPLLIVGGVLIGAAAIGYAAKQPAVKEAIGHVDSWAKGDYGTPVADVAGHVGGEVDKWAKGDYGAPVSDAVHHAGGEVGKWANGEYGSPVADTLNHVSHQAAGWLRGWWQ